MPTCTDTDVSLYLTLIRMGTCIYRYEDTSVRGHIGTGHRSDSLTTDLHMAFIFCFLWILFLTQTGSAHLVIFLPEWKRPFKISKLPNFQNNVETLQLSQSLTKLTVDSAMGSVRPSPHLGSSIDLNGFNDQVVSVQALSKAAESS